MLTCRQVQMVGEGLLALTVDDVNALTSAEILDCFDEFGKYVDLDATVRDAVLQKTLHVR